MKPKACGSRAVVYPCLIETVILLLNPFTIPKLILGVRGGKMMQYLNLCM